MDKFTSMRIFIAAVEEGSFAAAARRFKLSSAMAGKHVSALESDLHVRLIQRSTRRLSLTDVGQRYYDRCKVIIEALDDADREASDIQATPRGLLRIAAPLAFGEMHLGKIVSRYLEQFPEVSAGVVLEDKYIDLLEERIDVAIRIGHLDDPTLVTRRLAPCKMVLCASTDFLKNTACLKRQMISRVCRAWLSARQFLPETGQSMTQITGHTLLKAVAGSHQTISIC